MLQGALSAIQSGNAGATPPAETAAGMVWVDTATRALKMRNIANNGWITLGSFASGSFVPAGVNQLTEAQAKDALSEIYGAVTGQILAAAIDARVRATGAPVNEAVWHPHDAARVGDGATGVIWDYAMNGNSGQYIETPELSPGEYGYRLYLIDVQTVDSRRGISLELYIPDRSEWRHSGSILSSTYQDRDRRYTVTSGLPGAFLTERGTNATVRSYYKYNRARINAGSYLRHGTVVLVRRKTYFPLDLMP
ncbi:hypothetical protein JMM60_22030 [Rhodovulum sulfidophilum]|uniref:Uncharacterized protein n=3 Tax=Rhodovulum sulfidophilum TaxID=35806 RepID=A0ABS1RZ62_RHOSU|nr:hypothetical protein [Rhodovulum sulfidophilum]